MELKVKLLVLAALVVPFLVNNVDARLDQATSSDLAYNFVRDGNKEVCCKKCDRLPQLIWPPQYRCLDIAESCPANCKVCICTRSFPPQCRCADILSGSCDSLCKSEGGYEITYLT